MCDMSNEIVGLLTVIPMPVNAAGEGPETDSTKAVRTDWTLWDECNCTIAICRDEDAARTLARAYNCRFLYTE